VNVASGRYLVASLFLFLLQAPAEPGASGQAAKKPTSPLIRLSDSFQRLARRVSPSVVQIMTRGYGPLHDNGGTVATQSGTGSGVILDPDGYIITNAHVVEGASKVNVLLSDQQPAGDDDAPAGPRGKLIPAAIVGTDADTDLALLKIEAQHLPVLQLADSSRIHQGEVVLACGSPLGLENTISTGVISSVSRQIHPEDTMVYLQTDAPINPGNSGGALVDAYGRLVGINTFILTQSGGSEGLGFAIPSNVVKSIYTQLRKDGHAHRGYIGVQARTITPTLAAALKLPRDWGVLLEDAVPDSPAGVAGLRSGDIVMSLNGKPLHDARRFEIAVFRTPIGESLSLEVLRGTEKLTVPVSVVERANDPNRFADLVSKEDNLIARLGILVSDLNDEVAKMLPPLRKPAGALVAARLADAPTLNEDFRAGDLINEVNGEVVSNLSEFRAKIDKIAPGDPVAVQVQRQGKLTLLVFDMP
jgi:serine protease Do